MVQYGKTKIPTITIPKGTLLFRSTLNQESDYEGVDNCIPPQYNVFFYYNPFVVDGIPEWYTRIPNMHIYVASHDLEIVSLISPSKFTRMTRLKKKQFMIPCNKTRKSCLKPRAYDPCFRETFLERYPHLLGWTAIGKNDISAFKSSVKAGLLGDKIQYVQYVSDDRKYKGPPELALYPLKERQMVDIQPPKDKGLFNYEFIKTVPRAGPELETFMKEHAVLVPGKWYYTYKE